MIFFIQFVRSIRIAMVQRFFETKLYSLLPHPPTQKDDFNTIFKYAHLSAPQTGYCLLSLKKCQTSALHGKTQKILDRMSKLYSVLLRGKGIWRKTCHESESDSAGVLP